MTVVSYPAGAELGKYILETFVARESAAGVYLARKPDGGKVLLYIFDEQPDHLFEQEIEQRSFISHRGISRTQPLLREPVAMVESEYIPGLTIGECQLSQSGFGVEEMQNLMLMTADALMVLAENGCPCRRLSSDNVMLTNDGEIKLTFAVSLAMPGKSFEHEFFSFSKELVKMGDFDSCRGLAEFVNDLSTRDLTLAGIITKLENWPEKSAAVQSAGMSSKLKIILAGTFAAVLSAAAGTAWYMLMPEKEKPEVAVFEIGQKNELPSPQIYEIKTEEKTAPAVREPDKSEKSAAPVPVRRVKRPPRRPQRKPAVKRAPARVKKETVKPLAATAAKLGDLQALSICLKNGSDPNLPDSSGMTAMEYAAKSGWRAMINMLFKAGAKITPEVIASANDSTTSEYLKKLLEPPKPVRTAPRKTQKAAVRRLVVPNISRWQKPKMHNWNITIEQAVLKSRKSRKPILLLFTGADWCGPCRALEKQVLSESEFRRLARRFELVYINFPRKSRMPAAQQRYNNTLRKDLRVGGGVPRVLILDSRCRKLAEITGYGGNPKNYLNRIKRFARK